MDTTRGNEATSDQCPAQKPLLEYGLSWLIALEIGARWGHCYENAYPTFFALPPLFEPDGLFVEGWIVYEDAGRVVLMEHGWCLSGGKTIIDPTIVLVTTPEQPVHYFPGVYRNRAELDALANEFFPHVRFEEYGADGMEHAGYRAAYEAAQKQALELLTPAKVFREVRATVLESTQNEGDCEDPGSEKPIIIRF